MNNKQWWGVQGCAFSGQVNKAGLCSLPQLIQQFVNQ